MQNKGSKLDKYKKFIIQKLEIRNITVKAVLEYLNGEDSQRNKDA